MYLKFKKILLLQPHGLNKASITQILNDDFYQNGDIKQKPDKK